MLYIFLQFVQLHCSVLPVKMLLVIIFFLFFQKISRKKCEFFISCIRITISLYFISYNIVLKFFRTQVGGGRAAPSPQTVTVDVPNIDAEGVLNSLSSRAKAIANRVMSAYLSSADVASSSGHNMMAFLQRMNDSAGNLGTTASNTMEQMRKAGSQGWSGLLSTLFNRNQSLDYDSL